MEEYVVYTKWCSKCQEDLPLDILFGKNKIKWDGYQNWCKHCRIKHYFQHKEEISKYKQAYYQEHRDWTRERVARNQKTEIGKEIHNRSNRKYHQTEKGKIASRISCGNRRSRKNNTLWNLTPEEWKCILSGYNHCCAYCDNPLTFHDHMLNSHCHQAHIIPVIKGGEYTCTNIVPSCKSCNLEMGTKPYNKE